MDIENIIEAADMVMEDSSTYSHVEIVGAHQLLAIRDYYETLIKAERAEVIGKVREFVELYTSWDGEDDIVIVKFITAMLDELEHEER